MRASSLVAFAALTLATVASAQRQGQPAPEITWLSTLHFHGIKNEKLSDLKGSAVLLEFFVKDVDECEARLPKLQALHEREFDRGLVVLIVTFGDDKELGEYFDKHGVTCPIGLSSFKGYDPKTLPYTVLIAPDGKVDWADTSEKFDSKLIEPLLANARPANLAAGLEEVGKLTTARKYGEAYQKCKELLAGGALSAEAKAQAEHRIANAESMVGKAIETADKAMADGDFFGAFAELEPLAAWAGVPRADEAAQKLTAMLADKKQKREIDAGKALAEVMPLQRRREYDEAFKAFKKVGNLWSGTKAGTAANAAALAIEKGGKLGFDRGCGACNAADKTCSVHAKKRKK